ncbi:hypothetical protein [Falsiruegeria mediterranea]|uniref:Uncharacterized protein n=1 Tax=Falsiruegeria mediterranea M17 TaxID=1200281 RepID=A0A2R8CAY3_9RHOB|nr:hypothetical protein [Falsiruegeria mediterranea]SPJ29591.1 hypothetical protein TRM7615_03111 [Falsiruegeria mediterranea M17]
MSQQKITDEKRVKDGKCFTSTISTHDFSGQLTLEFNLETFGNDKVVCFFECLDRDGEKITSPVIVSRAFGHLPFSDIGAYYKYLGDGVSSIRVRVLPPVKAIQLILVNWLPRNDKGFVVKSISMPVVAQARHRRVETVEQCGNAPNHAGPSPQDMNYLREFSMELSAKKTKDTCKIHLGPIGNYSVKFDTVPSSETMADSQKVALFQPAYASSKYSDTPLGALHFSPKYGYYKYAKSGPNTHSFVSNEAHSEIDLSFLRWVDDVERISIQGRCELIGLLYDQQVEKISIELSTFESRGFENVVLVYTGTTEIGKDNRANRSMMLAKEFEKLGWGVIYVYVRSDLNGSIMQQQVVTETNSIIQIPNDMVELYLSRLSKLKASNKLVLQSFPDSTSIQVLDVFGRNGWTQKFEARDDWEEFFEVGAARWYKPNVERYLAQNCDAAVSVSPALRSKMGLFGADPNKNYIVPNAAGSAFIRHAKAIETNSVDLSASSPKKAKGTQPKIGYFGHLTDKWFNWPVVLNHARNFPNHQIEIIGHGYSPTDLPDNVKLLGPMNHDAIISVGSHWSLGIIPFVSGRLANAVDPIKIYEYLCLELPVLSVYMEQIKDVPKVWCYRNDSDFSSRLLETLEAKFDRRANTKFVGHSSWADRASLMIEIFEAVRK